MPLTAREADGRRDSVKTDGRSSVVRGEPALSQLPWPSSENAPCLHVSLGVPLLPAGTQGGWGPCVVGAFQQHFTGRTF